MIEFLKFWGLLFVGIVVLLGVQQGLVHLAMWLDSLGMHWLIVSALILALVTFVFTAFLALIIGRK